MAKKIVKVEDEKKTEAKKSNLDLGKITKTIMENGEAIGKITDGINEILTGQKTTTSSGKTVKKATSKKEASKKSDDSSDLSKVIDIAEVLLKK